MARGHKIEGIPEVPVVCTNAIESLTKTKSAVALLKKLNAYDDVQKCQDSKKIRAGKGKLRNRRYTMRRGPLVIYNEDHGICQAFRNLPGVDVLSVDRLNLLKLCPGGHLGRFCIWSEGAFKKLDSVYGTWRKPSTEKTNYNLPRHKMTMPDLARLINSDEIQSVVRPVKPRARRATVKKNPLKNSAIMSRLNPYARVTKRAAIVAQERRAAAKDKALDKKRQRIANNYLSLKAYCAAASGKIISYTTSNRGQGLSAVGDVLATISAMSNVKTKPARGVSAGLKKLVSLFGGKTMKGSAALSKYNGLVNEYTKIMVLVRRRWPYGLGHYLLGKIAVSIQKTGLLKYTKVSGKAGQQVVVDGLTVGLANKLSDFDKLAVHVYKFRRALTILAKELPPSIKTSSIQYSPPVWWAGN